MSYNTGATPALVIAFPGAGGSAGMFSEIRKRMSGVADLIIPDTPGRGRRTRSQSIDVRTLIAELSAELRDKIADREYTMFGACFGALIAYELLREQRRQRQPMPTRFLVCGRAAPDLPWGFDTYAAWSDDMLDEFMRQTLPASYQWEQTPAELREIVRNRLRKDIELGLSYEYREESPLDMPIHAYGGQDDTHTSQEHLESWRRHTTGGYALHMIPGGTSFYLESPDLMSLALIERDAI